MALVGYARVSTTGQSLDVQLDVLKQAGCTKIFQEKRSGRDGKRAELARCLEYVREGDILFVSKLDRLARSTGDLYAILGRLKEKGVGFRCLDNPELDTTTKHGKLLLGVLALIADFESDIRYERQMEGIAKAKERGVVFGRQPKLAPAQVSELQRRRAEGAERRELMRVYDISKASFYRLLKATG